MSAAAPGDHTQGLLLDEAFALESGLVRPEVSIAYRTWGTLNRGADKAIVVCLALTGSSSAAPWADAFNSRTAVRRVLAQAEHRGDASELPRATAP